MKLLYAFCFLFLATWLPHSALAQTTKFTYQGQLTDSGATQASYQMRFRLFDALASGSQVGGTVENTSVAVNDGIFTVTLDFGSSPFSGADRFLEIAVRRNGGESYTVLSPRQQIASSPYAIRTLSAQTADVALNAQQLGGVAASEYVKTTDVGSSFINNGASLQDADFNINGSGFIGDTLGIGTTTIDPFYRLDVVGTARVTNSTAAHVVAQTTGGTNSWARFYMRTANTPTGTPVQSWYIGTSRNFNDNQFYIADETAAQTRMSISTSGLVGINSANPQAGLDIRGTGFQAQERITDNTSGNSLVLQAGAGGNMKVTAYNYNNSTAVPLHLSTDGANTIIGGNVGIGTASPNSKLSLIGNAAQDLNSLGFPKAMVYSAANGDIDRCYNGTTGSSSGNCGFSVNLFTNGGYGIDFGFPVANRFVSLAAGVTADFSSCNSSARFGFPGPAFPNNINVYTFCTDEPESTVAGEFMIIVF